MVWVERSILVSLLCIVAIIAWPAPPNPTSAEIRLDTGDIRYLRGDEVIDESRMPEPYRATLLDAATNSPVLKDRWHRCATFPLPSSNHSDRMCQRFYKCAATWMMVDHRIGLHVAEDVAKYIEDTNAADSLPESIDLIQFVDQRTDGTMFILDGWQNNPYVLDSLKEHGLLE